ncbi:MAG: DUF86 domain-containing protein [Actinomycetota bacterium]|nr:DUF86 domain-containing protein [Actinomycetota bacterium]
MSGQRDESLVMDDIVDAAQRLAELGGRLEPTVHAPSRDVADQLLWNLTVLGEAVKRLQPATRARYQDVEWAAMAATRDVVVHHYEGVDWEIVIRIAQHELPGALPRLREILAALRAESDGGACASDPHD